MPIVLALITENRLFSPNSLKNYLGSLFEGVELGKASEKGHFQAYISFTKWWQIKRVPTMETLYQAFRMDQMSIRCSSATLWKSIARPWISCAFHATTRMELRINGAASRRTVDIPMLWMKVFNVHRLDPDKV